MTQTPELISLNDACKVTSLSRTGINKARRAGRFPQAVSLDGRRIAFVRAEVLSWINSKIDARDARA
ncbi:helix-turn-helix transcriptional regulator [Rhizobium sp. 9140]|uniref:helix-turn-helix transcriptional regulator n=1 Tax=Rhizobium sp. 9140 TaxID=1761900 RepID=UPI00079C9484|nr:AlpA family phage regulatory protein [Rhizobium sp. 9140]CZT34629.1 transcriptional regulator, AlpA family [Rhizobium sp. 9140]